MIRTRDFWAYTAIPASRNRGFTHHVIKATSKTTRLEAGVVIVATSVTDSMVYFRSRIAIPLTTAQYFGFGGPRNRIPDDGMV